MKTHGIKKATVALATAIAAYGLTAAAGISTWQGGGGDDLASNSANWVGGVLPTGADDILVPTGTNNMIWDGDHVNTPQTVNSWTQDSGYTGTVTHQHDLQQRQQ